MFTRRTAALLLAALLAGCAATPSLDRSTVDLDIAPREVASSESMPEGTVNWGGRIVAIRTVDESSEIEVLSFPLTSTGRPDTRRDSDGRFIAVREGFVDPLVYGPGRAVSVVGRIMSRREGSVGDAPFTWPVVAVVDMAPVEEHRPAGVTPYFSIGVGIGF